jgi:hypothetical protein
MEKTGLKIGSQTLSKIRDALYGHLQDHHGEIDTAYQAQGDELSISFTVKMAPGKKGGTDYDVSMSFVKDKVKVRSVGNVDENQTPLPFDSFEKTVTHGDTTVSYIGKGHKSEGNK